MGLGGAEGLGGGLFFSAYHSRAYGIESPLELADERFHMNFFYIGPEFVARLFFSDYWSVKTGLGLGAFFSREKVRGNSRLDYGLDGWGGHFQLGLEYRLAEHVGVGVNGGYVLGWFPGKDFAREFFSDDGLGELGDSGKHEGLDGCFHFFVTGGLRFYF
ncbi:outer membrane beta-barrel protein [Paraprevotella xylaniphila]|uniref:outer membrane beta-barrel protein n=1 Tax=Paraprevotella xylaniphila TaxID=454155 RepID=UPI001E3933AA|nr:outer membrane beta-barrel protein [Paraprevotella xylaniphila]